MTVESLQMILTTIDGNKYKVRWLRLWNSSRMSRKSLSFSIGDLKEPMLVT